MSSIGVELQVAEGVTASQLHDEWLRLFHRRNKAAKSAERLWQRWRSTVEGSAESDRLWSEYSAFQSEYRVLAAWTNVMHSAWVFATDGRECSLLTEGVAGGERVSVPVS
jgi:hypothetical protein